MPVVSLDSMDTQMTIKNSNRAYIFYAITLALAVAVALAVPFIGEKSLVVTMMTPTIATIIMLTAVSPEGHFREITKLLGLDRLGLRGWPLAVAGPTAIHVIGFIILLITGLAVFTAPHTTGSAVFVAIKILSGFIMGTIFAFAEETGWRGYMLPRLLGMGIVPAMLVVSLLHGVWHLPIMLTTDYYHNTGNPLIVVPLFLTTLSLAGIFYGFLRIWTGSVWPVAITHSTANFVWEIMNEMTQTKSALVLEYVGGESGLIMIGGLLAVSCVLVPRIRSKKFRPNMTDPTTQRLWVN
jgi:uncharacterized protein